MIQRRSGFKQINRSSLHFREFELATKEHVHTCVLTPLIFSFVYILQLGNDLWPHSREGSEKPITKDFQFSHLT